MATLLKDALAAGDRDGFRLAGLPIGSVTSGEASFSFDVCLATGVVVWICFAYRRIG